MKENYYVPAGDYTIINKSSYAEQINIYSNKTHVFNGYEEPVDCKIYLLRKGESRVISVPNDYHITLTGSSCVLKINNNTVEMIDRVSNQAKIEQAQEQLQKCLTDFGALIGLGLIGAKKVLNEYPDKKVLEKALRGRTKKIREKNAKKIIHWYKNKNESDNNT